MSASAATAEPIQRIPIEQLHESPWNPRQYYPEAQMQELVESMKASGYREWLPLMVRPIPASDRPGAELCGYEIGAGHRRRRAAQQAGIKEIPCIVREMTDEQFLDVLNFDNTGREDVHPLHEASGWQQWMEKTGKGVLDIAARIGQSKEYVYQRLKYSALIDEAKKAFLDDQIKGGHAILIARLQPDDQAKALRYAMNNGYNGGKPGVRELAGFIQRDIHLDLQEACFNLASSDLLPQAGSCDACPKRTRNATELMLPVEQAVVWLGRLIRVNPNHDECMDPGCFREKVTAHLVQLQALYEQQNGKPLLRISSAILARKGADYGRGDFEEMSDQPREGFDAGVWMDGPKTGKLVYALQFSEVENDPPPASSSAASEERKRIAEEARKRIAEANRKRAEKRKEFERQQKVAEERQAREDKKRQQKLDRELAVRSKILEAIRSRVTNVSRVDIEMLLADFLHNAEMTEAFAIVFPELDRPMPHSMVEKALSKLSDLDIYRMAVLLPLFDELDPFQLERPAELLLAAAKRYKVDAGKIRREIEEAAKTEEGDRREVGKAQAKKAAKTKVPAKKVAKSKGAKKAK